ncbi:MAG: hypothetical protein WBG46_00070 [Nonlabens sp.]
MKKTLISLMIGLLLIQCKSTKEQNKIVDSQLPFTFEVIEELDDDISETSGLEYYDGKLITHNDSGDEARIYFLNENGELESENEFEKIVAIDWEDISRDEKYLYIADTGNNRGDRKDLRIYKIDLSEINKKNASFKTLGISYPDQTIFDMKKKDNSFDAEALIAIDENLFVFTKDRKNLKTAVYKFDKQGKNQKAKTVAIHDVKGLVTGATYDGKNQIMICGYNSNLIPFVIPVKYKEGSFDFGERFELPIQNGAQVEAITYAYTNDDGKDVYYLTSESAKIKIGNDKVETDAMLYKMVW